MNWRINVLLALLGLAIALGIAQFQHFPGYLDSDYYFADGMQLAQGNGFREPYLWNYLDNPDGLPHPSPSYWMPLSSIISAAGMWITRSLTYNAGRLGFLFLAMFVPIVTAALAFSFTQRRELALVSGLLAIFSIYYLPFIAVTDNYGPYLILGGLYFLTVPSRKAISYFVLGLLAGLITLARSDGLLWFGLAVVLLAWRFMADRDAAKALKNIALAVVGFLLIMGPWFWWTYSIYGSPLAPGGHYLLWLKNYDEIFLYPASQLTMKAWLAQGWRPIVSSYLFALQWNLLNTIAAQGGIFLFPFILVGLWKYRKDERIRVAALAWLGLVFVMTFIFPFAGARGGFFHSAASLQPLWWALAPLGLEVVVDSARRRNWFTPDAYRVFRGALVGIAILMTAVIVSIRVLPGWGEGEQNYRKVETYLQQNGIQPGDIVMVRNPPGYYLMTGRSAIVIPYGGEASMLAVATRYHARYLIIEAEGAAGPIRTVYDNTNSTHLHLMSEIGGIHIYQVRP
jgi:hypothetical protein